MQYFLLSEGNASSRCEFSSSHKCVAENGTQNFVFSCVLPDSSKEGSSYVSSNAGQLKLKALHPFEGMKTSHPPPELHVLEQFSVQLLLNSFGIYCFLLAYVKNDIIVMILPQSKRRLQIVLTGIGEESVMTFTYEELSICDTGNYL